MRWSDAVAELLRGLPRPRESALLAHLEMGGRVAAALVTENDLPEHWSADVVGRRAVQAVLRAVARLGADRD